MISAAQSRRMPLQNRVTPFGEIIATPERGTMLGNRGILHDERRQLVRTSHLRRWICCVLEFKGIRRTLMTPRSWTELFFLDEATAFAAGHRPCFECRRPSALAFQRSWAAALGTHPAPKADDMDRVLGSERRLRGGTKKTYLADPSRLPDGVFVACDGAAWLLHRRRLLRWTPGGYADSRPVRACLAEVLTPAPTAAVLAAGYVAQVHESAR
jgi:hypothetical protein